MSLPLERWSRQAVLLERKGDLTPAADCRILRDLSDMRRLQRLTWAEREKQIRESDYLRNMPEGTYGGLLAYPSAVTISTTSIAGTVNLWPQATYSPIPGNGVLAPQAYRVAVAAKITTGAASTIGYDPRLGQGTWTTGGTAITGQTLGAMTAVNFTATITNAFYTVIGDVTIRTAGTAGTAVGMFHLISTQALSGGVAGPGVIGYNYMFGGTQATVDFTAPQGFGLGAVHTVATVTHNVEQIHWMDWN